MFTRQTLTVERNGAMWIASFSNGHTLNESNVGHSPVDAIAGLAQKMASYYTEPVIQQMASDINRIAADLLTGCTSGNAWKLPYKR